EDERLRVDGNLQRVEDRPEVPGLTVEGEHGRALLHTLAQLGDRIVQRRGRVGNRRMVPRLDEHVGPRLRRGDADGHEHHHCGQKAVDRAHASTLTSRQRTKDQGPKMTWLVWLALA